MPKTAPDRIRGFTTLADYEGGVAEGHVVVAEHDGATLRRIWHDGQWWWSVVDVVGALAETRGKDAGAYWRKLKQRLKDEEGAGEVVTACHALALPTSGGSQKTDCATLATMLRIVQSVPSKRAEPIKRFLAEVGAERIEELDEPSAAVGRAIKAYRERGRPDEWIDDRLQNISSRNELTDEWKDRGIDTSGKIAGVTRAMSEKMLGVAPKDHKVMKALGKKDELRDHYDGLELTIATLGEKTAKALIVERDTQGYQPTRDASMEGAQVAEDARRNIEIRLGRPVANGSNFLTVEGAKRAAVAGPDGGKNE